MRAIMFGAYYCGYCAVIWDRVFEPLADEGYDVQYVDAMKQPGLAHRYGVRGNLPQTVIIKNEGHTIMTIAGEPDQDQIRRLLSP